ncbi:PKD domain-containing protein [Pedobacter sp. L105]|uniref:PKD domain-containing protein n=1 Tax=Pedobacter sp. L105 TaxID=1641871 RepID=UPI00131E3E38|nr:PKD domain-containing protein [Pedobacter sp. L105]
MYKRVLFVINLFFLFISVSFAQQDLIHVDPATGTANVTIPLYTLSAAHVSLPISLTYSAKGVGVLDDEGTAGMGWNFNAGGSITRQVHGLPDDVEKDMAGNNIYGWIYGLSGSSINNLSFKNDNNITTYTDVAADISVINNQYGFTDTEPDIFYVNAPGLNFQLVYDSSNSTFRTIPYQDIKIAYTTNTINGPAFGEITSFTVTNDMGIVYTFSATETTTKKVVIPVSNLKYFKTAYNQYLNGISYTSTWKLSKIQDTYNNTISLTYNQGTKKGAVTPIILAFPIPPSPQALVPTIDSLQYSFTGGTTPQLLSNIAYSDGVNTSAFSLSWNTSTTSGKPYINSIQGFGHNFSFTYVDEFALNPSDFSRSFLRVVTDGDCTSPFNYSFAYNGENPEFPNKSALPDSADHITSVDNYGYLASNSAAGSLSQINYSDGGHTNLVYEPNNYYSPDSSRTIAGSGIRIKQILHNDGINTANNISINYSYLDPVSGITSGKPISLPVLSFIRPYGVKVSTAELLRLSTISSSSDLSDDDHTVLYQYVTESHPGAGSTLYQFAIPGTKWDTAITDPFPWSPTIINTGSTTTTTTGLLTNTSNTYPFPPNPNYDFERGLPIKTVNYDGNKNEVSESTYNYQNSGTPINITALKYDVNAYGVSYSKYNINTNAGPLTSQVISKVFDLSSTSLFRQTITNYTYNTTQHKLIQESTTNSDGSIKTSNFVYAKDFNTTVANDGPSIAIKALQQLNMNIPVEHYTQVIPFGSSQARTVSAELVKFSNSWPVYATNMVLPATKMQFTAADGVTDFAISDISNGNFVYDPRYFTTENDLGYDFSGNLLSKDNGFKNIQTILTDHNFYKTAAIFSNARFDEIATSDFDSRLVDFNFNTSGGSTTSTSRSGQYGWALSAGQTLSKTINKNAIATNYVFSIWVNAATAGQFTVSINGGTTTNTRTISYGITSSNKTGWQYCEIKIPLTGISSSAITITASSNQNVVIDDVLAYPDVAGASTYAYDQVTRTMTAETNTNGVSKYYTYDQLGRLHYMYDQDKNILLRKQYTSGNNVQDVSTIFNISGPTTTVINTPVTFNVVNPTIQCAVSDVTYTWNFGDGSPTVSTFFATHTYAANGTYTVSLTASSTVYGTVTKTSTITVSNPVKPTTTTINYINTTQIGGVAANKTLSIIESVSFLQGTTVVYQFTTAQLTSGVSIVPGNYTINVKAIGPLYNSFENNGFGYAGIEFTDGNIGQCQPYVTAGNYTFSKDLTNTPQIYFIIQNLGCQ